ncbi:hypothetical protein SUGI_0540040 [Cryptomeria japonica]|nr:hypothetical protein SUGI_0540040 [Cryptomeria japonica]
MMVVEEVISIKEEEDKNLVELELSSIRKNEAIAIYSHERKKTAKRESIPDSQLKFLDWETCHLYGRAELCGAHHLKQQDRNCLSQCRPVISMEGLNGAARLWVDSPAQQFSLDVGRFPVILYFIVRSPRQSPCNPRPSAPP